MPYRRHDAEEDRAYAGGELDARHPAAGPALRAGRTRRLLGGWIDRYGFNALFWAMLPFSAVGASAMVFIWLTTRGRDVKGS